MHNTLIVGGTKGIGLAISNLLSQENCIIFSRSDYNPSSSTHHHMKVDVIHDELPELENLQNIIYCPGSINLKPFGSLKEEDFVNDHQVNFMGAVKVIKKYFRQISKVENANIILFSTVAVTQGMPFHASISSAKGAIEGLTRSLAGEFAGKIKVNCVAPTLTNTPLASGILRNEEAVNRSNERHPTKRINNAEDVAKAALFLLGDHNMTGQIIHVDGGLSSLKI